MTRTRAQVARQLQRAVGHLTKASLARMEREMPWYGELPAEHRAWIGMVLGMAMVINMFIAATAGTLIPLGLRALRVDPALASSVFITTLTDVFGFFAFLGLGHVFLKYLRVAG